MPLERRAPRPARVRRRRCRSLDRYSWTALGCSTIFPGLPRLPGRARSRRDRQTPDRPRCLLGRPPPRCRHRHARQRRRSRDRHLSRRATRRHHSTRGLRCSCRRFRRWIRCWIHRSSARERQAQEPARTRARHRLRRGNCLLREIEQQQERQATRPTPQRPAPGGSTSKRFGSWLMLPDSHNSNPTARHACNDCLIIGLNRSVRTH
jgi:hypothetical protein